MEYNFTDIEERAKSKWANEDVYKVLNESDKPKCYILDMFPYPSGAGLHVGHPLGYIASDIYARYKKLCGYNVLHPMGFDAFGLPAEQYAIETGQHPAVTTEKNIARYREQLDNIGFCYDWSRAVRTSDASYYKWTQWIFLQLFHSWYDRQAGKARPIKDLTAIFEKDGNSTIPCAANETLQFDNIQWSDYSEKEQRDILMQYRLAYQGYAQVWWCEALGTVLANDEVVNGVSERGGHPVERKNMRQWFLRITEYADRLLTSLDSLEWSDSMKEMQRNWIGKSSGAEVRFGLTPALSGGEGDMNPQNEIADTSAWQTADGAIYDSILPFQNKLKNNLTESENILWQQVRNNKLGVKFRRQHIIGKFIADFICLSHKLVVEVDGKIHDQQKEADAIRTKYLQDQGYKVIRFTNDEVESKIKYVLDQIKQELKSQTENIRNITLSPEEGRGEVLTVFTTRPDTIFGVDFLVLAPEHSLVDAIVVPGQKGAIEEYKTYVKSRSERERMSEVKSVTGCFTGAYAIHPLTQKPLPIWISEYVLAGYGTGAIMAVPSGDDRDHAFAKHFNIPITNIFGDRYTGDAAYSSKTGTIENSGYLTGLSIADAAEAAINELEDADAGTRKINYRLRDAGFSRQRYWGEPFPIIYVDDIPYGNDEPIIHNEHALGGLPVELPMVEHYKPGPEGQGPLANIEDWVTTDAGERETNTMPGYAGSSWYFLRYMDPHNDTEFASRKATDYWNQVDLYIGGTEHAVGHLLYSRMWTKALYDLGHIGFDEPFKKLLNQGMIQGNSYFVKTFLAIENNNPSNEQNFVLSSKNAEKYFSKESFEWYRTTFSPFKDPNKKLHIYRLRYAHLFVDSRYRLRKSDLEKSLLMGNNLHPENFTEQLKYVIPDGLMDDGEEYLQCDHEVEKMSKSKYNVVNPDDIVKEYGADTFRMYEMFLGPIDVSKPWDTKGIEGVHRFLKKMWRLYADEQQGWIVNHDTPTDAELRILHKTIKKISEDIERFSFNTSVSQFMICVNELSGLGCHKQAILEPLAVAICPFAPHMAEELWQTLGNSGSVINATFPKHEERYVTETNRLYPVAVNGKTRAEMEFPLDAEQSFIEKEVLAHEAIQKWMEGKPAKKFIYVRGKMINVVV